MPVPTVLGILGGIASGKSEVAESLIRAAGSGLRIDADRIAREVLEAEESRAWLAREFGPAVLDASGAPDRAALAARVFSSPEARARLEGWTHPKVRERIRARLDGAVEDELRLVVLDVPLLLENDALHELVRRCDALVFVDVPAEERERRAVENRNWKPGELARREAAQLPLEVKRARADYTIANHGTRAELDTAVAALLPRILASAAGT